MLRKLRFLLFLFSLIGLSHIGFAQTRTNSQNSEERRADEFVSSNLPVVIINTNGQTIMDETRIVADMGIIYNHDGERNYLDSSWNEYNGKISIEFRGSSSQALPKKSYSLETQDSNGDNNNVSLLDMPEENDWVLYAPYSDKSLLRNVLAYHLGNMLGDYAPRTKFCELLIDGEYQGVYVLIEKIKRDVNRVAIAEIDEDDISGDSLTGGYIVKIDKTTAGLGIDWSSDFPPIDVESETIDFQIHYPKDQDLQTEHLDYIKSYISNFEDALSGDSFRDVNEGYPKYIDVASFIDYFLINEMSRNIDAYRLSTFFYKKRESEGGKLFMGPIWDFNRAFGNANYCEGSSEISWASEYNSICPDDSFLVPFWWDRLCQDKVYKNQLVSRWRELRNGVLETEKLSSYIESMVAELQEAQLRNFDKWPVLGTFVWPNDFIGDSYEEEIDYLEDWIINRVNWIDNNIQNYCCEDSDEVSELFFVSYPNPSSSIINIDFSENDDVPKKIIVLDGKGVTIEEYETSDMCLTLDISKYAQGIYLIRISKYGKEGVQRIVKL